jgi:formylglycine-generating enzyme required for sulfatase activity
MVKVDAGTYEVGRDPADDYHSAPQSISLNEFWIDQYQTTNAEYQQYLTATGAPTPIVWPGEANHPVRGVTWDQALAYCGWLNKRLPNEAEWEAAGRGTGPGPQLHPWGDDPTDGGNVLKLPNQNTYEVGSQSFNVSPLQVYDMAGNIWEWVGEPYSSLPEGTKILRGGRFGNPVDLAYRLPVATDDPIYQYAGFRCAADQVR